MKKEIRDFRTHLEFPHDQGDVCANIIVGFAFGNFFAAENDDAFAKESHSRIVFHTHLERERGREIYRYEIARLTKS